MRKTILSVLVILFSLVCVIGNGYAAIVWEENVTESGELISLVPEGFSKFPEGLELDAGSSKTIEGVFSQRFKSGLKEVIFKISGIDDSWYELEPTEIDFMEYNTGVPIKITLNIPEDVEEDIYNIRLSVESKNVELDWTRGINLKVNSTTTTTIPTTILEENETEESVSEEKTIPIGTFTLPSVIVNYWHYIFLIIIVIVVTLFIWMFYPRETFKSTESRPTAEPKVEEKKEVQKPEEIEKILTEMTPRERLEASRERRIKEIRERALEMDKKLKGKGKKS